MAIRKHEDLVEVKMSQQLLQEAITNKKMRCPQCKGAIQKFDKYVETVSSVWDGAGDSHAEPSGSKVTLICGNSGCDWRERTEFWTGYIVD